MCRKQQTAIVISCHLKQAGDNVAATVPETGSRKHQHRIDYTLATVMCN